MSSQRSSPPSRKRSHSGGSRNSYASAATTVSRASSKLLFGEFLLTPATNADGLRKSSAAMRVASSQENEAIRSHSSIFNLVLSTSPVFLRFWLNDACRDNALNHMEPEDLSNFRLVCHDFSSKAAPRLFKKMTVTFKTSTFSKPARIQALSRIGRHVKTFTFQMPHGPDTCLPPIIDPRTGTEKQFVYEPQVLSPQHGPAKDKAPKYGTSEMQDLLIKQYPPLFHAATNVPAFCAAFSELINLIHLKVSCPGSTGSLQHRRDVVDYALISLHIAVEHAPLCNLCALSLYPVRPGSLPYLHPMHGLGSTPTSGKRWGQVRRLSICMEVMPFTSSRTCIQPPDHLLNLHAYLAALSRGVKHLSFRWKGERGPSPFSLQREPCMLQEKSTHPPLRGQTHGRRPLKFSRLRVMELENALMDAAQVSDFITKHEHSLCEFSFENVKLREGDWGVALEPLTAISGSDAWKRHQEEVMDVPIMLSPVDAEPRVVGSLLEEAEHATEQVSGKERREHALSRWLGRGKRALTSCGMDG